MNIEKSEVIGLNTYAEKLENGMIAIFNKDNYIELTSRAIVHLYDFLEKVDQVKTSLHRTKDK